MDSEEFYRRGKKSLERAITADENKDYPLAKEFYERACEEYLIGLRRDANKPRQAQMVERVKNYLSRAETVKGIIAEKRKGNGRKKLMGPTRSKSSSVEIGDGEERGFDKIAGLEHVKQSMREAVILPMVQPQLFKGKRVPWKGVLLFGPPGTGKTYMAQALSEEAEVNFVSISASDIVSKWQGESEKAVKSLFEEAKKSKKPTVIFIDEVDSIGGSRDKKTGSNAEASRRLLTELLKQMDGVGSVDRGITVIGATNHAEDIDSALRRRFEKRLYVPLPGMKSRLKIFELNFGTDTMLHSLTKSDLIRLTKMTKGYSASDLTNVVNEALMMPVRLCHKASHFKEVHVNNGGSFWGTTGLVPCASNDPNGKPMKMFDRDFPAEKLLVPKVTFAHVKRAIAKIRPSVSDTEIRRHEKFAEKFCGDQNITSRLRNEEEAEEKELLEELNRAKESSMMRRMSSMFSNPFLVFTNSSEAEHEHNRTAVPQ
uniref:Vesicle-fusing ATPase n=1 Tax=Aplanochytrium stocchinoi TaxID=215587 RepID=A0A7S3PGE3_9STRA|eukprot:CAMPEP_0204839106 /NCGR_PEP_ID=MMETSP1346-20131115/33131_1 /ASSEMBLY_ACC=CAM_ASM_000771 /TAXON_ID=215587 /ORGANISM="Aplanochytrium stocchinoi, Strain GSBS06" /LENGTH=484 /DNA_ID=CAMNT_0051975603 /DNA_START=30 /DNA_END=1484 /DNA_ORIENTATION=-